MAKCGPGLLGLLDHRRGGVLLNQAQVQGVRFLVRLILAYLLKRDGQAKDALRVVGHQVQGLAQVGDGLVNPFEANQQAAQVAMGVAIMGVDFDGLFKGFERLLRLAHPVVGVADAHPRMDMPRTQLDGALEPDDGLVVLAQLAVADAQVVEDRGVCRRRLGQALQVGQRLVQQAQKSLPGTRMRVMPSRPVQ